MYQDAYFFVKQVKSKYWGMLDVQSQEIHDKIGKGWSQQSKYTQVHSWTSPKVWRSKCRLSVWYIHRKYHEKTFI